MTQFKKYDIFSKYHSKNEPLILINTWDQNSSKTVENLGIKAIATSSFAMAEYYGYKDGENIPFKMILGMLKNICSETGLPVTADIESGYAKSLAGLKKNIEKLIECGIIGLNIEDKVSGEEFLYSIQEYGNRIKLIKEVNKKIFINARTDTFFTGNIQENNSDLNILNETIKRGNKYKEFGADGLFIPGLKNKEFIKKICDEVSIPINIMLDSSVDDINDYLGLGVSRISYGPSIYLKAMEGIEKSITSLYNNIITK